MDIGDPIRKVEIQPARNPIPQKAPAVPHPQRTPRKEPAAPSGPRRAPTKVPR